MQFSEILTKRRKLFGITQDELAEKLDVSRQSISKWENGECMPEAEKLIKLSDILDISLDELMGRKNPESTAQGAPQIAQAAPAPDKKSGRIRRIITAAAAVLIGALCFLAGRYLLPYAPEQKAKLPDELTASCLGMELGWNERGCRPYPYREIEICFVSNYDYTYEEDVTCTVYCNSNTEESVSARAYYKDGFFSAKLPADPYTNYQDIVFTVKSGKSEKSALIAKQLIINGSGGYEWTNADDEITSVG